MAIQVRRGKESELDISKAVPGEWLVSTDTRYVRMCFAPGIVLRMATYEAFEADMAEIQSIVAEARTIEEAVARIQAEINDNAIVVEDYAILSKSYAVGGTGTRENEDVDNAKYYYEQAKHISQGGNGLVPLGTIAFENLPTEDILTNAMYNISNDFTSDERFLDGGGILYGKGSNVFYTADGKWDVLAASDVKGVKGEAEDTFRQGNVNITKGNIGLENVDNTSDANKPISNEQQAEFDRIDSLLGDTDISDIADGTLTGAVDAVNENLESIHEKYITTDASGTVIENTELATFLLRNIGSVPANGTKTIDYVNSAGQSGSFVVSKMSDVYFSGLYFTPFMSRPCYFTHNNGTWTWEELAKNSDLEWKLLGTLAKNSNALVLPSNFGELYVYNQTYTGAGTQITIHRTVLGSSVKTFSNGFYATPQSNFACAVSCSISTIAYGFIYRDGQEVTDKDIYVYYR